MDIRINEGRMRPATSVITSDYSQQTKPPTDNSTQQETVAAAHPSRTFATTTLHLVLTHIETSEG
jgi:hypothetical protein